MDRYALSTLLYLLAAALSVVFAVVAVLRANWLLLVVCAAGLLVALDNAFCGTRARAAGCPVHGHWVVPPFLRR